MLRNEQVEQIMLSNVVGLAAVPCRARFTEAISGFKLWPFPLCMQSVQMKFGLWQLPTGIGRSPVAGSQSPLGCPGTIASLVDRTALKFKQSEDQPQRREQGG